MHFGDKIRILRTARGYSQRFLAQQVGSTDPIISQIENGHLLPAPELEQRLLSALGYLQEMDAALSLIASGQPDGERT